MASPDNATQNYLYRTRLDGKGEAELLSPAIIKRYSRLFIFTKW